MIAKWFPPKIKTRELLFPNDKMVWEISTLRDCYEPRYFLSYGGPATSYNCSAYYRGALKEKAAEIGVELSHDLFEMVFGPIDSEIMKIYEQVRK